jgi:hypothetical protein
MLKKVFATNLQKTYNYSLSVVMLKNNTKLLLKKKFNFNPYSIHSFDKEMSEENKNNTISNTNTNYVNNKSAFIDIPNYLINPSFKTSKQIMICMFQIVSDAFSPFILYLLHKTKEDLLQFITLHDANTNNHLKHKTIEFMNNMFPSVSDISYAGYVETNDNNIIILKCAPLINEQLPDNYYLATTHELVNLKNVANIAIAKNVIRFFINNQSLLILRNDDDIIYNTPVVGYYESKSSSKDFKEIDIFKESLKNKLGKYYLFSAALSSEKNDSIFMRAVVFLNEVSINEEKPHLKTSIIYNKNGNITYAIKHYSQHMPLSYHTSITS